MIRRQLLRATSRLAGIGVAGAGLAVAGAAVVGVPAVLATVCPTGTVGVSGTTVTTTFGFTGAEQCISIPDGVTQISVTAVGGAGGNASGGTGGEGADVSASLSNMTGPTTLYVEVGGTGVAAAGGTGGSAQFNGGGQGGNGPDGAGGGGGGASDVRTCSVSDVSCPTLGSANDPRLVVAGGGGGAVVSWHGGAAGSGSSTSCNAGSSGSGGIVGGGGGGCSLGSPGGAGGGLAGHTGGNGSAGLGGQGLSQTCFGAGGGGGGYFGGGGGGGDSCDSSSGGGGSSFVEASATTVSMTNTTSSPSVVITYQQPATTTTVQSSVNPANPGQSVTYTATVSPLPNPPGGTVDFADGGTTIPGCGSVFLSGATATCTVSYATTGTHDITATYSGDVNYQASPASAVLAESVVAIAIPTTGATSDGGWAGYALGLAAILAGMLLIGGGWSMFFRPSGFRTHG
ncbi:MAG TPA: Ig-like domain-containing protein [Candidatus Saccharimonadales bacterium]|nr:Ig-like domain-containing protein [Candidatus Saccharimonadales bacterium]